MARWCARYGAVVTVADTREAPASLATLKAESPDVAFVGGPFTAALVEGTPIRAVYRSPGLSPETIAPVADAARAMGLPVGGELDLFARALLDLRTVEVPVAEVEPEPEAEPAAAVEAEAVVEPVVPPEAQAELPLEAPVAVEVPEPVEAVEPAAAVEVEPEPIAPAAMAEAMPRDPSMSVAVPVPPETPVETEAAAEPEATPQGVATEVPAPEAAASESSEAPAAETPVDPEAPAAPAPTPTPATVSRLPSTGKPYVPTAAKEAAEFVAKIAEISATNPASAAVEEEPDSPQLELAPPVEPEPPKGYTPAVLAITGTNGKTTTTALTGQLVERSGQARGGGRQHRPDDAGDAADAHRRRRRCRGLGARAVELPARRRAAASSPTPPRCSTSRRTTSTGTARWPPTRRPRRASSARARLMVAQPRRCRP